MKTNKNMKKIAIVFTVLLMLLAMTVSVNAESKKAQHKKYVKAIEQFNRKNVNGAKKWSKLGMAMAPGKMSTYFAFADIDKNGTDECIVCYAGKGQKKLTTAVCGNRTEIYTLKNGKVKKLIQQGEYGAGWYPQIRVYKKSNLIEQYTWGHSLNENAYYRYKSGNLAKKATYSAKYYMGDKYYYVNGKKTNLKTYKAFIKKMTKKGYPMYQYTKTNLNKHL